MIVVFIFNVELRVPTLGDARRIRLPTCLGQMFVMYIEQKLPYPYDEHRRSTCTST